MSLINAVITRDRAMVAVDTRASVSRQGSTSVDYYFEMSKMIPMVHANVILASRGENAFLTPVFFKLSMMKTHGFDTYATAMEKFLLKQATDEAVAAMRAIGAPADFDIGTQEIYLIGWSESRQSMAGSAHFRDRGEPEWEVLDMDSSWANPWGDDWGEIPEPDNYDALVSVAREQVTRTRAEAPEVPIGGRLIIAELDREGMSIRSVSRVRHQPP